ncbi:MAG: hypothetical protein ABTQ29_05940 [Siculibacillus sp.]
MNDAERDEYVDLLKGTLELGDEIAVWMLPFVAYERLRDHPADEAFVRRCILRLLDVGAAAVRGGDGRWDAGDFSELSREAVADAVLDELALAEDPCWVNVWFVERDRLER